jgi:hypothetical protein
MKNYYAECQVNYIQKPEENNYHDKEIYSFIIEAKDIKTASIDAIDKAFKEFNEELQDGTLDVQSVQIINIYETTEDARCS